jgi:hypothetical protein
MPRRATIQLKVHRQLVQSLPLDDADIECLVHGSRSGVTVGRERRDQGDVVQASPGEPRAMPARMHGDFFHLISCSPSS